MRTIKQLKKEAEGLASDKGHKKLEAWYMLSRDDAGQTWVTCCETCGMNLSVCDREGPGTIPILGSATYKICR